MSPIITVQESNLVWIGVGSRQKRSKVCHVDMDDENKYGMENECNVLLLIIYLRLNTFSSSSNNSEEFDCDASSSIFKEFSNASCSAAATGFMFLTASLP